MSAFLCSPNHLKALADWINRKLDPEYPEATAYALVAENLKSLNYRYNDTVGFDGAVRTFAGDPAASSDQPFLCFLDEVLSQGRRELESYQVNSLCKSYDYQACEHPTYEGSYVQTLIAQAIAATEEATLKAHEHGPWEI